MLCVGDVVMADSGVKAKDGDYVVGYIPEYGDVAMRYKEHGGRSWVECNDGRVELGQCTLKGVIVQKTVKFNP